MPYRAAVIGLGNIGMGYDYNAPIADCNQHNVLTHAQAFASNTGYDLVAGVDPDANKRERFKRKFHKMAYATIDDMCKAEEAPIDVYALAVPTHLHNTFLMQTLALNPKGIICEKPFVTDSTAAQDIYRRAKAQNCPVLVNYFRRYLPQMDNIRATIQSSGLGACEKGTVYYSRGMWNNAGHFLDLISRLLGPLSHPILMNAQIMDGGGNDQDWNADFSLQASGATLYFIATQSTHFSYMDLTLQFEKGRLHYSGEDLYIYKTEVSKKFPERSILQERPTHYPVPYNAYQAVVADVALDMIEGKRAWTLDLEVAINIVNILETLSKEIEESSK